jgi:hypothetical protein
MVLDLSRFSTTTMPQSIPQEATGVENGNAVGTAVAEAELPTAAGYPSHYACLVIYRQLIFDLVAQLHAATASNRQANHLLAIARPSMRAARSGLRDAALLVGEKPEFGRVAQSRPTVGASLDGTSLDLLSILSPSWTPKIQISFQLATRTPSFSKSGSYCCIPLSISLGRGPGVDHVNLAGSQRPMKWLLFLKVACNSDGSRPHVVRC